MYIFACTVNDSVKDSQTELWQQAETDEQWEASIAGSHVPALTDWFLHKHFIEGMSVRHHT